MQIHFTLDTTSPQDAIALQAIAQALKSSTTVLSGEPLTPVQIETIPAATATPEKTRTRKSKTDQGADNAVQTAAPTGGEAAQEQTGGQEAAATSPASESAATDNAAAQTAAQEAPADQKLTLEFLRAQFTAKARADKKYVPEIRALLKDYGVADLSGLPKDKYAEIYKKLGEL